NLANSCAMPSVSIPRLSPEKSAIRLNLRKVSSDPLPRTPIFVFFKIHGSNLKKCSMAFFELKKIQSALLRIKESNLLIVGKMRINDLASTEMSCFFKKRAKYEFSARSLVINTEEGSFLSF